ncbi:MAG: PEGA domain-containing protein [Myxococcales bacterium]|nr:PEGA domain-containing protein [Myxococcales bacterium]
MTTTRRARILGALAIPAALLWCAACPTAPRQPPPPPGGLAFAGGPAEALVTINESLAGTLAQLGENPIHLQAGTYRVQVAAPGHFPWYGEVAVGETVETVTVELRPVPE